ncbi:hypothetical protein [Zavarzinia compransoris]|uniref:Uncharacterized protein n=1 Tax=Zavarzinia compransoris TaxID=1264899 RepID=A0A317E8Q2_9PROT|nr:hypothetical protein [Zavarzinia compransoris]PWR23497.1 hypothetical protein DKG75_02695 [Zavarzinia compransoris]TDP45921.1 hypothetical protein DES42_1042 [Zavarzinia compransoris]
MLRSLTAAAVAALSLCAAGPAFAGESAADLFRAQSALFGLDSVNDKIVLGGAHLLCREAALAATTPEMPWSPSRRTARFAYGDLGARLTDSAARADSLLLEGLRDAGVIDATPATIAMLADRVHKTLVSRLFQVNPATANDLAISCKTLAAGDFNALPSLVAAR